MINRSKIANQHIKNYKHKSALVSRLVKRDQLDQITAITGGKTR